MQMKRRLAGLPSGKRLHNYGTSPFLMGKSDIHYFLWPFSIAMLNYQRVNTGARLKLHGIHGVIGGVSISSRESDRTGFGYKKCATERAAIELQNCKHATNCHKNNAKRMCNVFPSSIHTVIPSRTWNPWMFLQNLSGNQRPYIPRSHGWFSFTPQWMKVGNNG